MRKLVVVGGEVSTLKDFGPLPSAKLEHRKANAYQLLDVCPSFSAGTSFGMVNQSSFLSGSGETVPYRDNDSVHGDFQMNHLVLCGLVVHGHINLTAESFQVCQVIGSLPQLLFGKMEHVLAWIVRDKAEKIAAVKDLREHVPVDTICRAKWTGDHCFPIGGSAQQDVFP